MAYSKQTISSGDSITSKWGNDIQTQYDEAMKETELRDYKTTRSNKDSNGIFTTIQLKRPNNTLAIESTLSGGTSPKYTTRTVKYYDTNGTTLLKTTTYTLSYDSEDDLISEV